jgi:hypothetical protein
VKATFVKTGARRYAVMVARDRHPNLWCGSIGYDDFLPHDLLHFVAEAEFGLDGGIFGDLAVGGNARLFLPLDETNVVDMQQVVKLWRKQRIRPMRLPEGPRSERLAWELHRGWHAKTLPAPLQEKFDELAERWQSLQVGGSVTLEWPRPERRKRHPPRERRRPVATRQR